ncbi:MAG: hypothetical protein IRZ32_17480 [Solirubrobacteraceae bacterium]|nr:hypothetical protein [Solirubrobacteraceae bacterium]
MGAWVETASEHFTARHGEEDAEHADVVLHASEGQLALARPALPLRRWLTAPAARRYVAGAVSGTEIHVLSPPLLEARASGAEGSAEMLARTPAALYARLAVGHASRRLPPPARIGTVVRAWRWAWLVEGIGAWLSGQTALARAAIARRLHEGPPPAFPPALRDAVLLGGTVVDLLAREEGEAAAVRFAVDLDPAGPRDGLVRAFHGRRLDHTEATWRAHLARLAGMD